MHIGLDYDETASVNPRLWQQVVHLFQQQGWKVSIVSIRPINQPNQDILAFASGCGVSAHLTSGRQKAPYMESIGEPVDIWIDDAPECIPSGTTLLGMAIGCVKSGEPVDPERSLPGQLIIF